MELNKKVIQLVKKEIPDAQVTFDDFKQDGKHFFLSVTSAMFQNLPLVDQHRTVMNTLKELLDSGELHAIKIKTRTP